MELARAAIRRISPTILTYRDIWCDGMLVTPFPACKKVSRSGLYTKYGMIPWAKAANERWANFTRSHRSHPSQRPARSQRPAGHGGPGARHAKSKGSRKVGDRRP